VRPDEDPILSLSGIAHGLPPDASERVDYYLNQPYVAARLISARARPCTP